MANIDVRKKVRVHIQLVEALQLENLKEIDFEVFFFWLAHLSKSHVDETEYILKLPELEQLTGHQYNLQEYVQSAKKLRKIDLVIDTEKEIIVDGLFNQAKFIKGTRSVRVTVSKEVKPYILDLTQNYQNHQLYSMLRLKSKHAKKLYMYLIQHRPKKGFARNTIESKPIEEFKRELGYINSETGKEMYEKFGHFNDRVLKTAKKEINSVADIKFSYTPKKWGRQVMWLDIDVENKNNEELIKLNEFNHSENYSLEEGLDKVNLKIELFERFKLTEKQAETAVNRLNHKMLENLLEEVKKAKPDNIGAYTVRAIYNEFGITLKP